MTMISLAHRVGMAVVDDPLAQTMQRFEARFPDSWMKNTMAIPAERGLPLYFSSSY
ncbi:MAG TPA: hypothetical protein VFB12_27685 [Ktedonobacteraceae bacterium]|nr:hypothetical protein [Ktedonobacteraceae bacterium]